MLHQPMQTGLPFLLSQFCQDKKNSPVPTQLQVKVCYVGMFWNNMATKIQSTSRDITFPRHPLVFQPPSTVLISWWT